MDLWQLLLVMGVFLIAGGVKGVTGMGLPTVAMSLLGLWMAPLQAAALLVIPSLATNVMQCRGAHLRSLAVRLWPGWLAIAVVTVAAPGFGDAASTDALKRWLGAVLVLYGAWGLWRPTLPDLSTRRRWWSAVAGAATGVVTASTAVFVLPWVPYLQSLRLSQDEMVQALGLSFTIATLAMAVRVQVSAPLGWLSVAGSVTFAIGVGLALTAALTGLRLGESLRGRLAGPAFQRAVFLVFIALGAANIVRAG